MNVRRLSSLAPIKGGGRPPPPKADETSRKLLEEDVKERPAAMIPEKCRFLRSTTVKSLSTSTVKRLLKRMGFSQKTDYGGGGKRRVAKSRLEGHNCGTDRCEAACFRR